MQLAQNLLYKNMESMPVGPEHTVVWHLCKPEQHSKCARGAGSLAIVHYEAPDIPDQDPSGFFLMRLHPLERHVINYFSDFGLIYLPRAVSFPHSTVWSPGCAEQLLGTTAGAPQTPIRHLRLVQ